MAREQTPSNFGALAIRPKSSKPGVFLPRTSRRAPPTAGAGGISKLPGKKEGASSEFKRVFGESQNTQVVKSEKGVSEATAKLLKLKLGSKSARNKAIKVENQQARKPTKDSTWTEDVNAEKDAFAFMEQVMNSEKKTKTPVLNPISFLSTNLAPALYEPAPIAEEARITVLDIPVKISFSIELKANENDRHILGRYLVDFHEAPSMTELWRLLKRRYGRAISMNNELLERPKVIRYLLDLSPLNDTMFDEVYHCKQNDFLDIEFAFQYFRNECMELGRKNATDVYNELKAKNKLRRKFSKMARYTADGQERRVDSDSLEPEAYVYATVVMSF